jgi:hypothetical protein
MANVVNFPGTETAVVEITADKIRDAIIQKAGPGNAITTKRVSWYPLRDAVNGMAMLSGCPEDQRNSILASMKRTVFDLAQPCPLSSKLLIFGLFENETDIHVYCMGPSDTTQPGEEPHLVLARYTLSKSASIYSMDEMTPNAFIDELSDEFVQLREGMNSAEKERSAVLEYGDTMTENPPGSTPYTLSEFLDDLREGVHLQDEVEDEDEPDEPEAPSPVVVARVPNRGVSNPPPEPAATVTASADKNQPSSPTPTSP